MERKKKRKEKLKNPDNLVVRQGDRLSYKMAFSSLTPTLTYGSSRTSSSVSTYYQYRLHCT